MVNLLLLLKAIEFVCCKTFNTEFSLGNYSGLVKVHLGKYMFFILMLLAFTCSKLTIETLEKDAK